MLLPALCASVGAPAGGLAARAALLIRAAKVTAAPCGSFGCRLRLLEFDWLDCIIEHSISIDTSPCQSDQTQTGQLPPSALAQVAARVPPALPVKRGGRGDRIGEWGAQNASSATGPTAWGFEVIIEVGCVGSVSMVGSGYADFASCPSIQRPPRAAQASVMGR